MVTKSGSHLSLATYEPPEGYRYGVRLFPSFLTDSAVLTVVASEQAPDVYETWGLELDVH